ncbi:hypothetical protein ACLHDG_06135 [Sulfurovum sp. CS9]|uniref:hypothetical protein n=1 Tax=Sulfurovum sp. CS9 TaxID=3391146 RepID=UPI0039EB2169
MIKILKVSLTVLMGSSMLVAGANGMKLYDIKSGKVEYEITGSGEIMGQKMKTIGKKRVIFDNYGAKNLTEENKIDKQTIMGQTKNTKTHTMTYMKEGAIYHVDFKSKRIMRMKNMAASMGALMGGGKNMKQSGEEMMKKMGGKKTGTDNVLGYTCDVWEMMGTKQCMYKGIPLRVETDVMGIKNTEIATKAQFDLSLSSDDFKLPDFPIYDDMGNKLDKSKLSLMDKKAEGEAEEAAKAMEDLHNRMAESAKSAGIKEGERATKAQQKKMQDAMMTGMLPRMKKQFLEGEEIMRFGYKCLKKADTLKEANQCNDEMNTRSGETDELVDEWSPKTKKEILGEFDQYLNEIVPCVKKAQTMQAIKKCIPEE